MKPFPFLLPVRIEDEEFLVAANNELILKNWDATPEELEAIVTAINGYNEAASLLEDLRYNLSQYDDGEWYLHDGADKIVDKVDKFLESME